MSSEKKQKLQSIRMRQYKHPVKFDGVVKEYKDNGKTIVVELDTLGEKTFYLYNDVLFVDLPPIQHKDFQSLQDNSVIWEIV